MKRWRTFRALWKFAGKLHEARIEFRSACLMVTVEGEASVAARGNGAVPRTAYEVSYWRDRNVAMVGTRTQRGHELAEALEKALAEG